MARALSAACVLSVLLLVPFLAGCLGSAPAMPTSGPTASPNQTTGATAINESRTLIFADHELDFELVRTLGKSLSHGADIGESIETARRIAAHEDEGLHPLLDAWYGEWNATAERVHAIGAGAETRNHTVSAGQAYLRASEYYRNADFFLHDHPENPEIVRLWDAMHADFVRGLALTGVRFEEVEIPYENTTLHGYFFPAHADGREAPTVIVHQGFDGIAEECWFGIGADAVARGYNVLAFDGPGQGRAVRKQGLHFRPDWDAVVSPVLNWTLDRPEVDPDRVALYGISMGGYLAPRAAAHEHRLAAVIANEGVYDAFESSAAGSGMSPDQLRAVIHGDAGAYNQGVAAALEQSVQRYWVITHGLWAFGVETPAEMMAAYEAFTMKDAAALVRCPVLVIEAGTTQFFTDQSRELYNALPAGIGTMITFGTAEGAGLHCQAGAQLLSNQRIFDWLDETLSEGDGNG